VNILCLNQSNPLYYSSSPLFHHAILSNSFQCISLYLSPVQTDVIYYNIIHFLPFFCSFSPQSSLAVPLWEIWYIYVYIYMYVYIYIHVIVFIFVFGSIFHLWEKTCNFCLSEPSLHHLTWRSPVPSIYLWRQNFILPYDWIIFYYIYISTLISNFLNPFISLGASVLFP
jgi:hypothetical protein